MSKPVKMQMLDTVQALVDDSRAPGGPRGVPHMLQPSWSQFYECFDTGGFDG